MLHLQETKCTNSWVKLSSQQELESVTLEPALKLNGVEAAGGKLVSKERNGLTELASTIAESSIDTLKTPKSILGISSVELSGPELKEANGTI